MAWSILIFTLSWFFTLQSSGSSETLHLSFVFWILDEILASAQTNNTTQFGNYTIEWQNFDLLTCVLPSFYTVSLLQCLPSPSYTQVADLSCVATTTMNFDDNNCWITTTTATTVRENGIVPDVNVVELEVRTSTVIDAQRFHFFNSFLSN